MGGFHLKSPNFPNFPINAEQLHYLVSRRYLQIPDLTRDEINDRNKSDGLARFITLVQVLWFSVQIVARAKQSLAITTLEVTTMGFIFCQLGIVFCWRHKPMDVQIPVMLEMGVEMGTVLRDAGDAAAQPYFQTPMDFAGRDVWIAGVLWQYYVNILWKLRLVLPRGHEISIPIQKFSSITFHRLSRAESVYALVLAIAYSGIFLSAWNFYFPTVAECYLWRTVCLITTAICVIGGSFEAFGSPLGGKQTNVSEVLHVEAGLRGGSTSESTRQSRVWYGLQEQLARLRNNSPSKDPALSVPLRSLVVTTPICALYTICRCYVLLEDLISLREVPASAYQTVEWEQYWPHF